jgi:hypothetical protein
LIQAWHARCAGTVVVGVRVLFASVLLLDALVSVAEGGPASPGNPRATYRQDDTYNRTRVAEGRVYAMNPDTSKAHRIARALEVALKAVLSSHHPGVVIERVGTRVNDVTFAGSPSAPIGEPIVRAIQQAPKPMRCTASLHENEMVIQCDSITEPQELENWSAWINAAFPLHFDMTRRSLATRGQRARILVRYANEFELLSVADYEEWRRNFRITLEHSMALTEPDAEAAAAGAKAMLIFGTGAGIGVSRVP